MPIYKNYPTQQYDNLKQMLHINAERFGEKAALLQKQATGYHTVSYRGLCAEVDALGTALLRRGLGGKKILLIGRACRAWATAYLALLCGVGVVIPMDAELSAEIISSRAKATEAEAAICPQAIAERLSKKLPTLTVLPLESISTLIREGREVIREGDRSYLDASLSPDAPATVVYTSGSRKAPRAVMLSHRNLCHSLSEICRMVWIDERDTLLSVLPLTHIYGCVTGLLCPLCKGASTAFCEGYEGLSKTLREVRPSVLICLPCLAETLYCNLLRHLRRLGLSTRTAMQIKLTDGILQKNARMATKKQVFSAIHSLFGGRLRLLVSGGDRIDPACLRGYRSLGITALQGYGMTETSALITLNRDTHPRDDSVGMPTPHTLLDIYNASDAGIGEIRVRGDNLMLGYYNDPAATEKVIREGWFYTGDLGMLDSDGYLTLVGRMENRIRVDQKDVYPEELELLLNRTPLVGEAVVVGYAADGQRTRPIAMIRPDPTAYAKLCKRYGEDADRMLDIELRRTVAEVNAELAPHKRMIGYVLRQKPFPKTASHKLLRRGLAKEAAALYEGRV